MVESSTNNHSNQQLLEQLESAVKSTREIALLRMRCLGGGDDEDDDGGSPGLPFLIVELLRELLDSFFGSIENRRCCCSTDDRSEHTALASDSLLARLLKVHLALSRLDPTLGEELGRQGSHALLGKLVQYDVSSVSVPTRKPLHGDDDGDDDGVDQQIETLQDTIMELQDLSCEISACGKISKVLPLSVEELKTRLPLLFHLDADVHGRDAGDPLQTSLPSEDSAGGSSIGGPATILSDDDNAILVRQVTNRQTAQEDVGFGRFLNICSLLP